MTVSQNLRFKLIIFDQMKPQWEVPWKLKFKAHSSFIKSLSQLNDGAMVSPAPVRHVGINFLGLKRSLRLLARLGESAERRSQSWKEPSCSLGNQKPDQLWPTLSNPNPSLLITTLHVCLLFPFLLSFWCWVWGKISQWNDISHIPRILPTALLKNSHTCSCSHPHI